MKLVVVFPNLTDEEKALFEKTAAPYELQIEYYDTNTEALPHVSDADIVYGMGGDLCKAAEHVKWFASTSAGVNAYFPHLHEETILTGASGAYGMGISEHVLMVTLELLRQQAEVQETVRKHEWKKPAHIGSLYGKNVLLLGTGDIGTHTAKRVKAFEPAELVGLNRSGQADPEVYDRIVTTDKLEEELPKADIVIASLPETSETFNLLTKERLGLMKEGALLINVGRGSLLDEDALYEALRDGKLGGAALDVFRTEPLPVDSPLYRAPNIILTPHCSGVLNVPETRRRNITQFLENIPLFFEGKEMKHVIDIKKQY